MRGGTTARDKKQILLFNGCMITVIGLGNPGKKYEHTRHNIGFMALDAYAALKGVEFIEDKYIHAQKGFFAGIDFIKPQTFMNDSGKAAAKYSDTDIVVVYDDIDITLGTVKCSFGRGAGGHNGVQSIIDHTGTKDFFRIRIGVRPVHEELMGRIAPPDGFEKFLLSDFAPFEKELCEQGIQKAIDILSFLPTKTFQEIMNEQN